jgi:hypothetical protein
MMVRPVVATLAMLIVLLTAVPVLAQSVDESEPSEVTFVNGIRGFFTDVYLDDELILEGFAPERITEPLQLEPGQHRIDLREPDAPADGEPAITKEFDVPAGGTLTAIAHWTGVDDCIISVYDESGGAVSAGSGKLIARHTAATGDVEFALDDKVHSEPLASTDEFAETVTPGSHTVAVKEASAGGAVIDSSRLPVSEGNARVVYLVGNAEQETLGLLTQNIEGLASNPDGVPTGNSGLATADGVAPAVPLAVLAIIGAALLLGSRRRATVTSRG